METHKSIFSTISLLLVLTSTASIVAAQQTSGLEDPPWLKNIVSKRIVYSVPGMKQAQVRRNLIYKRAADSKLEADVYSPASKKSGVLLPAVIFIHGGFLPPNLLTKPKEWGVYVSYGQLAAAFGFIGVTFNHRYYGYNYLDEAQADVDDLIAYIRSNGDSLGIDKDRIFVWAFSGGGIFLSHALRDSPAYLRGIIAYYTVLDLRSLRKEIPLTTSDDALKEYSPLHYLSGRDKLTVPMFIARAGLDDAKLNKSLDAFVQEATQKNANLDFSNHNSGQHGFDVSNDDQRSREIIKQTLNFIKNNSSNIFDSPKRY